jgi:hypothetical protein
MYLARASVSKHRLFPQKHEDFFNLELIKVIVITAIVVAVVVMTQGHLAAKEARVVDLARA